LDRAREDRVDIHEGIETTLTLLQHETGSRISVHKRYGRLPPVWCFPHQLNQVFMNILVNAIQAIEGRGEVTISTFARDDAVFVEIEDSGVGIPPEHLSRIFEPGFTTKGVKVGTGLGLSIVHRIIQAHGGKIEVESQIGRGSKFRICLPFRRS
jgi:two-component system, NtrC family, sensor kinase